MQPLFPRKDNLHYFIVKFKQEKYPRIFLCKYFYQNINGNKY